MLYVFFFFFFVFSFSFESGDKQKRREKKLLDKIVSSAQVKGGGDPTSRVSPVVLTNGVLRNTLRRLHNCAMTKAHRRRLRTRLQIKGEKIDVSNDDVAVGVLLCCCCQRER